MTCRIKLVSALENLPTQVRMVKREMPLKHTCSSLYLLIIKIRPLTIFFYCMWHYRRFDGVLIFLACVGVATPLFQTGFCALKLEGLSST